MKTANFNAKIRSKLKARVELLRMGRPTNIELGIIKYSKLTIFKLLKHPKPFLEMFLFENFWHIF